MTERPILFSDAMVRAILSGAKAQTRRPVDASTSLIDGHPSGRSQFSCLSLGSGCWIDGGPSPAGNAGPYLKVPNIDGERAHRVYPRIAPGDLLWVRECWAPVDFNACDGMDRDDFAWCTQPGDIAPGGHPVLYRATAPNGFEWDDRPESRWRPSIHMPRWASRISLRVVEVRVERVQDISEEDARAEGVYSLCGGYCGGDADAEWSTTAREAFAGLWRDTYGPESWTANPWVWVVSFERVEANR